MRQVLDHADLQEERGPKQSVVELLGEHRVLVEYHKGILEYGPDRIGVKMGFGKLNITGNGLRLGLMTCEKLVILGKIHHIEIQRGMCP